MGWKKKKKELTPEQATELAKKEAAPFWLYSPPLFIGMDQKDGANVYPLEPEFIKKTWILFFFDLTTSLGFLTLKYALGYSSRFSSFGINFLGIITPDHPYGGDKDFIERSLGKKKARFPILIDENRVVSKAFNVQKLPHLVLYDQGSILAEASGEASYQRFEENVHVFLRKTDPGLPLAPFIEIDESDFDAGKLEFGSKRGTKFVQFNEDEEVEGNTVHFSGQWNQEKERITTSDPEAFLILHSPGKAVSFLCQSLTKLVEPAKVVVEVDDQPAYENFCGKDLYFDEEGRSVMEFRELDVIHPLVKLPDDKRKVTLRFPQSKKIPVALYGVRFTK